MKTITISFLLVVFVSLASAQELPMSYSSRVSDSECQLKGYDCALKNKCVKDLSLKPFARFHPKYKQAIKEVTENPVKIFNWPQIYYICSRN